MRSETVKIEIFSCQPKIWWHFCGKMNEWKVAFVVSTHRLFSVLFLKWIERIFGGEGVRKSKHYFLGFRKKIAGDNINRGDVGNRTNNTCMYVPNRYPMHTSYNQGFYSTAQCLKITEKVSFNIASEASFVYILRGQKLSKNAKNGQFWRGFENLKLVVKQCYQTGHL